MLGLVIFASCDSLKNNNSETATDSTNLSLDSTMSQAPVSETLVSQAPEDDGKGNYQYILNYLVEGVQDSTQFQTIRTSCALKIELTKAEIETNNQREAEWQAIETKSDSIWDVTEHDSASIAEREETEQTIGDDDMWYRYEDQQAQEKLLTLDSMKVTTFTASDKSYLKMIGRTGKVWMVDIRTKTEPGRTIVLFNIDKEPIILDRLDINTTLIRNYFFSADLISRP